MPRKTSPILFVGRILFGTLTCLLFVVGLVAGFSEDRVEFGTAIGTALAMAAMPGMIWLLTYVNKAF